MENSSLTTQTNEKHVKLRKKLDGLRHHPYYYAAEQLTPFCDTILVPIIVLLPKLVNILFISIVRLKLIEYDFPGHFFEKIDFGTFRFPNCIKCIKYLNIIEKKNFMSIMCS